MNASSNQTYFDLEGFFEEAEDHLREATRIVLDLERLHQQAQQPLTAIQKAQQVEYINHLFRSFHTLKGLCGMVGLAQGADLSHSLESILRALQLGKIEFSTELFNGLIDGIKGLSSVIAHLKDSEQPSLNVSSIIARLASLAEQPLSLQSEMTPAQVASSASIPNKDEELDEINAILSSLNELEKNLLKELQEQGLYVGVAIYDPTQHPQSGSRVNQIRDFLNEEGKLIKALPLIQNQTVRFIFLFAGEERPQTEDHPYLEWKDLKPSHRKTEAQVKPTSLLETAETTSEPQFSAPSAPPLLSSTIRIDLNRLDTLMQNVGDLIVTRSRLEEILPKLKGAPKTSLDRLEQIVALFDRQVRTLRQMVVRMRMVPLADIFSRLPLVVRDLAQQQGKEVNLVIEGEETEVDKALGERLLDPLLHLVRNAIAHGIEFPQERLQKGKDRRGTIQVRGYSEGEWVIIEVRDDGAGINVDKVSEKAVKLGWIEANRSLGMDEVLDIISRPGFSTRDEADLGSGRGVGMNVVVDVIRSLGGHISLSSETDKGTVFTLKLPLTLTIIDAIIVEVGNEHYAIPRGFVHEAVEIDIAKLVDFMGMSLMPLRDNTIPLFALNQFLGLESKPTKLHSGLIIGEGEQQVCLMVDRLVGIREMVVHPIQDPLLTSPGIRGATETGDGRVILVLDPSELVYHFVQNKALLHKE